MNMKVVLASQSPRRKELLAQMGVEYEIEPSRFDEHLDDSRPPEEVAVELALGKAKDVARHHPDSYVIGSDTIVSIDGNQLAKPADKQEAYRMLKQLSGKTHKVITAVAIINKSKNTELTGTDITLVSFIPFNKEAADRYVSTGDSLDKAGGYGIQSGAAPLIDHIKGNYDTVMGLPTKLLADMLREVGVNAEPVNIESPVKQVHSTR